MANIAARPNSTPEKPTGFTTKQLAELTEIIDDQVRHIDVTQLSGFDGTTEDTFLRKDGEFAQAGMTQAQILARIAVGI
jgi:hypothetical protein